MTPQSATATLPEIAHNLLNPDLFSGGPPNRLERSLGLIKPHDHSIKRRMIFFVVVSWLPLAVLVLIQAFIDPQGGSLGFFADAATQVRYLVALPVFVIAERDCLPPLGYIMCHMMEIGIIRSEDTSRFEDALSSTKRLLNSQSVELLTVVAAYAIVVALVYAFPQANDKLWHKSHSTSYPAFSAAGWWHALVSLPLLLVIVLGWIWRVVLWGRLQFLTSRLDLHLIPGHPDHCGGLKFVGASLRAFRTVAFGLGSLVSGVAINRVVHFHEGFNIFKGIALGLVVIVVILFAGPLVVYIRALRRAHHKGMFEYSVLAGNVGRQFERKWLNRPIDESALDVPDFSSTADLYGVVGNVYAMDEVPFSLKNVGLIVLAALVPLLPAALLVMPLKEIFQDILKLIL